MQIPVEDESFKMFNVIRATVRDGNKLFIAFQLKVL